MKNFFGNATRWLRCAMVALCCFSGAAVGNPIGAQVVNGSASINQSGTVLTVTNSPNAIINWQGFAISAGDVTRFIQQSASSAVLNRVTNANLGLISGQLTSNGKVFLINPNGILFGTSGILDVGALVASTGTPVDAASLAISTGMQVNAGWNLLGNSTNALLDVATAMGDASKVFTIWKWNSATGKWAFYTPSLTGQALTDYAASKGYDVLTTINSGEGFWVNAKTPFAFALPIGNLLPAAAFQTTLASGWNMVSVGENKTPSQFNTALSQTQPAAGAIPTNFSTLWAWDNAQSNWYFYAPSLEAQGGTALTDYITSKGYFDFTAANKTLEPGMGFWVNKP